MPLEADCADRMLLWSGRAFVLFRRMKGIQGRSSPPKRFDAKPSAFPVRRLCYLCAAPGRPTPKIPFESEEPVSYSFPSAANSRNRRPAAQIASVPFSHKTKFNFADRAGRGLPVPSAGLLKTKLAPATPKPRRGPFVVSRCKKL